MLNSNKQTVPFWCSLVATLLLQSILPITADELGLGLPLEDHAAQEAPLVDVPVVPQNTNGSNTAEPEIFTIEPVPGTEVPTPLVNVTEKNLNEDGTINCESFFYDCYGCIQNGCFWCPTDAACFPTKEFVSNQPQKQLLYPNRTHGCNTPEDFTETTCTAPGNVFADPVYSAQKWIFSNINVEPVWKRKIFGKGVRVRVNDIGIETTHPEFLGRVDVNASCPLYEPSFPGHSHGMTVASLLGASGNNSNCGVGIAPATTLSSCNLGSMTREEMLVYKLDQMDISQNSWAFEGCGPQSPDESNCIGPDCVRRRRLQGEPRACPFVYVPFSGYRSPCDTCNFTVGEDNRDLPTTCQNNITQHCKLFPVEDRRGCDEFMDLILLDANFLSNGECHFGSIPEAGNAAFEKGVTEGRNGKGIIYIFAAGNENAEGDNTNFQGYGSNSRYTITVGAVAKSGIVSSYSTPGASVFLSAPGGDDRQSVTRMISASTEGTCKDSGDGTSFAAPVVSGVVALMLEVNPNLGWRDVKEILAITSQTVIDPNDPSLGKNGAGKVHSNRYGFGIVNAEKAVNMSETWVNLGPERMLVEEDSGNIVIPDFNNTQNATNNATRVSLTFEGLENFVTEELYLHLNLNHSSRGHLRVDLTSPSGMISVMSPGGRNEDQQVGTMKFTSVRHWGENPTGTWTITIIDTKAGDASRCIDYYDYRFDMDDDVTISCARRYVSTLAGFCLNGELNPQGFYAVQCDEGNKDACKMLKRFQKDVSAGLTGPEACCLCGGGFWPGDLPDELLGWKIEIFGRDRSTEQGFFSGIGNGVELGKWGNRGRVRGDRFQTPDKLDIIPGYQRAPTTPPESSPNLRRRAEE